MSESPGQGKSKGGFWRSFREFIVLFVIALILALGIQKFLVKPFFIPSASMERTLLPGDRVLVNRSVYLFREPARGDVVVFEFPLDLTKDFIKRIIGLPGDRIEMRDGQVVINGKFVKENYINIDNYSMPPKTVEPGTYFVMGDNRPNSSDSRVWGTLPKGDIIGKAFMIYWPPQRIRWIN